MSNQPTSVTKEVSPAKRPVEVDPAIAEVIGDPERPAAVPSQVKPPDTLPGRIGLLEGMRMVLGSLRRGVDFAIEPRERYGDIYRSSFLDRQFVFVWDADEIHRILRNEGKAWSTGMGWDVAFFENIDSTGGNFGALLTLDFDAHRAARALVRPAFTMRAIRGYIAIARRAFEATLPGWIERGGVDFKPEARALLARVANELFTGIDNDREIQVIDRALSDFWHGMMALSRRSWMSGALRRSRRGFATLRTTFLELAPERRQRGGDDLFSHMCRAEEARETDDETLVRVFLTIMFGAFDTTSAGVTSMAYLLAKHPEWQERLREEALRVSSSELEVSSLRELKELDWVWKETLRLMPVNGFLPRRALRDVEVGGYALPAGVSVAVMQGAIGRHPRWWKEPLSFEPERFAPDRAEDKQHPALQMAFGAGPHACVGTQLAGIEMKLLFHRLLTSCRWSLEKDYEARHTFTPMGCVSGAVRLRLEPLSPA